METIYTLKPTLLPGGGVTMFVNDLDPETGARTVHSFRTIAHARNYIATRHSIDKRVRLTKHNDGTWGYIVKSA